MPIKDLYAGNEAATWLDESDDEEIIFVTILGNDLTFSTTKETFQTIVEELNKANDALAIHDIKFAG